MKATKPHITGGRTVTIPVDDQRVRYTPRALVASGCVVPLRS